MKVRCLLIIILFSLFSLIGCQSKGEISDSPVEVSYYSSIGYHFGVPFGINKLSAIDKKLREHSYKLEKQGGRLVSYSVVGYSGVLKKSGNGSKEVYWRLIYTTNGKLKSIKSFDHKMRLINTRSYLYDASGKKYATVTFKKTLLAKVYRKNTAGDFGGLNKQYNKNPKIAQHRLSFGKEGYVERLEFLDADGHSINDGDKSFGRVFEYSSIGRVTLESKVLKKKDELKGRWATIQLTYQKELSVIEYLDTQNEIALGPNGDAIIRLKHDSYGRITEKSHFGLYLGSNKKTKDCLRIKYRYDSKGNVIKESCFSQMEDIVILSKKGYASIVYEYSAMNILERMSYLGVNNEPVTGPGGYSSKVLVPTANGEGIKRTYFNISGEVAPLFQGVATVASINYDQGLRIKTSFLDVNGKPAMYSNSYAAEDRFFNKEGQAIRFTYFDTHGDLTLTKNGFNSIERKYDANGNLAESSFLGVNNELIQNASGISRIINKHDEWGRLVEKVFLGLDDKKTNGDRGFARKVKKFEDNGNLIDIQYYDKNGLPVEVLPTNKPNCCRCV